MKEGSEESPLWLIVLSDMMTNLMLFFIVMFAVSSQGLTALKAMQEGFAKAKSELPKPIATGDPLLKLFPKNRNTVVTAEYVKMTLPGPVLFSSGRSTLSDEAKSALKEIAQVLLTMPGQVVVEGHTDNVPLGRNASYVSNDELSAARSAAVAEYFIDDWKVDPRRFSVAGYGEFFPIGDNSTLEGRAQNRRIEIVIQRH